MNIYTARLDINPEITPQQITDLFSKNDKFVKILIFQEIATKSKKLHLHVRVECKQTFRCFQSFITKKFPMIKGTSKSTRNCNKKDKDTISSATYIAKDGNCILNRGHTEDELKEFITIGRQKWEMAQLKKKNPIYRQVIILYNLTSKHSKRHIIGCYYEFFVKYRDRRFPPSHKRFTDIQQIMFNLSEEYMNAWINEKIEKHFKNYDFIPKYTVPKKYFDLTDSESDSE